MGICFRSGTTQLLPELIKDIHSFINKHLLEIYFILGTLLTAGRAANKAKSLSSGCPYSRRETELKSQCTVSGMEI